MHRTRAFPAVAATLCLCTAGLRAQDDPVPWFSARGDCVVRSENEAHLRVAETQVEAVRIWLVDRYRDCGWLDRDGHRFRSTLHDDQFADTCFDDAGLQVLARHGDIRHRRRVDAQAPGSGAAGPAWLQFELTRRDPTRRTRTQIEFPAIPSGHRRSVDDLHALLGLVARGDRPAIKECCAEAGIAPYDLRPVLSIRLARLRVYVGDQHGALATVTLDRWAVTDLGTDARWSDLAIELDHDRYAAVAAEQRHWMHGVRQAMQADVAGTFPALMPDQVSNYARAFDQLEHRSWLPLRTMVAWQMSPTEMIAGIAALALAGCIGLGIATRRLLR